MSDISIKAKLEDRGVMEAFDHDTLENIQIAFGNLAKAAHNEWIRIAQNQLHSSRELYVNGLRQAESFKVVSTTFTDSYEVKLVGEMPNNIEFGMDSFDMKSVRPGWLGGSKSKIAKDGHRYVVIPFRHSTSSNGRFAYTGKAAAVSGPDLKTQLRKAIQDYGLNRASTTRLPNKARVHEYLKGLTRVEKVAPSGKKSSQYMTWRVMSENSPAGSWIHPGLTAANILPNVESWVDAQMDKIIDTVLGVE